jgi:hypothetical protein
MGIIVGLQETFEKYDTDGSGELEEEELAVLVVRPLTGCKPRG